MEEEIISLLDVLHSSTPYVDSWSKLLRTGTETKAVGCEWSPTFRSNQGKEKKSG